KILTSIRNQLGTSIIRLLPNGDFDTSFGNNGTVEIESDIFTCFKILTQTDEKIIVFGVTFGFEPDFNRTYRLNPDGSLDNTFGTNGYTALYFEGADIAFQEDGKLLVAGNTFFYGSSGENFVIARLNNDSLGIYEFEKNRITIYPNPSNGIFTIEREFSETSNYQITDITGKTIASGELGDKQTQIDLSSAQSGVYFLRTSNGVFRLLKN
ncbi:MAG TPA: T9SS type A sorting domain-containing protein, partial [Aequorivita sp.]|nr:T9SS type A sorting domain-containing protein [Aequorivita sp.]